MVASAEAVVENFRASFEAENAKNIVALRSAWEQAKSAQSGPKDLSATFLISHDIKGQGGTFGWTMLTEVADLLCKLLKQFDKVEVPSKAIEAIECHVAALELITRNGAIGDGGDSGVKLITGLKAIAAATNLNI
jgi:chemotaxis protein histidine kinase CheA